MGAYLPGLMPDKPEPLARFLPPVPDGVISTWLGNNLLPNSWVLDPFGTSPRLAVEAARAGYRVLVAANNPVSRFLVEMAAAPPSYAELQASLAELASAHKADDRIEPHIRSLYNTDCASCGHTITADAFLWERGGLTPFARIYHCPYCNDEGEHTATKADVEHAAQFTAGGLHRARALERISAPNDPDRIHAEEAISVYLPRAVYALFTLINRLDGLPISPTRRKNLQALLLSALDQGNKLWAYPITRKRPRQLEIPPRFRENNIWLTMERAIDSWGIAADTASDQAIPLSIWPELPPLSGGICLYEGRLKQLLKSLLGVDISAVVAAIPRTNQAFWSLSALWAGWLWGREAVRPFKGVLRRRRYGWDWHTTALYAALNQLAPVLKPGTSFLGLIGEVETGFITAALTAMDAVGFSVDNIALRLEQDQAQILWQREIIPPALTSDLSADQAARRAASSYLESRGEPASYSAAYIAALMGIVQTRYFRIRRLSVEKNLPLEVETAQPASSESSDQEIKSQDDIAEEIIIPPTGVEIHPHRLFSQAQTLVRVALSDREVFTRLGLTEKANPESEPEKSTETGLIWLYEAKSPTLPLADRVEMALVRHLHKTPGCTLSELDNILCEAFPALLTPDPELIQVCLDSYGERESPDGLQWHLRSEDAPAQRRKDLATIENLLTQLGERLGFRPQNAPTEADVAKTPMVWVDAFNQPQYWFYPIVSAVIGKIILHSQAPSDRAIIVLPGGRANLVAYKLRRDPNLEKYCSPNPGGWHFLKFRHLRWLVENPLLLRENLDELFSLDPLTYSTQQLRLL